MRAFTDGKRDVKRILVLELGGIGDVILAVPAIVGIRQAFPEAVMTVITVERARTVLERFTDRFGDHVAGGGAAIESRVVNLNGGVPLSREDFTHFISLRKEKYDLLVDLSAVESGSADFRSRLLVRAIAPGTSAGRGTDGRGSYYGVRTGERLDGPDHEMKRKLDVVAALGVRSPLSAPIFPILRREREEADAFFRKHGIDGRRLLAAIHPGGTGAHKRWPAERFGEAACWLAGNLGARVVVVGGPENERIIEQVRSIGCGAVVSAPFLSLGAVAAVLERCSLFLTNDSGPMHLAAALGVPTVAIFGQTNHSRYAPLLPESRRACSYADPGQCVEDWTGGENGECRRSDCRDPECLRAVSVRAVVEQLESLCSRIGLFYHLQPDERTGGTPGDGRFTLAPADAGFITRRARERAAGLLRGASGTVLDVACGKGYLLSDLAGSENGGWSVWGVDISMEQLRAAMGRSCGGSGGGGESGEVENGVGEDKGDTGTSVRGTGEENGCSRLVRGDIARLPFRKGTFDASLCVNTLLNLEGGLVLTGSLFEMARVTRPGGTVLVELRNAANPLVGLRFLVGKLLHRVPLHAHRLDDVLESGRMAGLALRAKHAVGPSLGPLSYSWIFEFEREEE